MLVAQNRHGKLVSVVGHSSRQRLRQLRREERFYCPICKDEVKLKVGNKNTPHFAHWRNTVCEGEFEGESEYHLLGKQQLLLSLQKQYEVELEPYLHSIRQRPDLLVTTNEGKFPVEFQCASLSTATLYKRTSTYKRQGYIPIWILGAKRYKRISSYLHELSPLEWAFLQIKSPHSPFLLYYSSLEKHLIQLQHIYPFSAKLAFAYPTIIPFPYVRLSHFFPKGNVPFSNLFQAWGRKKKKWRLSYMLYRSENYERFLKVLYEEKIPPSHFPAEAGIPHPLLYQIETPACIWQTYVLLDVFSKHVIGDTIGWDEMMFYFLKRVREKAIVFRHIPNTPIRDPYAALGEYIEQLCLVQMLKKAGPNSYKLLRHYTIPKTASDAFLEDIHLLNELKQMT